MWATTCATTQRACYRRGHMPHVGCYPRPHVDCPHDEVRRPTATPVQKVERDQGQAGQDEQGGEHLRHDRWVGSRVCLQECRVVGVYASLSRT